MEKMRIEQITEKLTQRLSEKRFQHSVDVSNTAQALARRYHCSPEKAKLAGLLHDCARELTSNRLLSMAEAFGIVVGDLERRHPVLLHALVGARMAEAEYGVADDEIRQAIAVHTTGGPNMTTLDKIIFLADVIEPGRSFYGVEEIRLLAAENLDKAVLAAFNQSIIFLADKNGIIHPNTIIGRNELLLTD